MDLFKAQKRAEEESRTAIGRSGLSESALGLLAQRKAKGLCYPPHVVAGTAANQVFELAGISTSR